LTLARNAQNEIFDRSKFKVTRDISPTISGWLLVVFTVFATYFHVCDLGKTENDVRTKEKT